MNTKKFIATALCAVAASALLVGCGDDDSSDSGSGVPDEVKKNGPIREPADDVWNNVCNVATAEQVQRLSLNQAVTTTDGERTTDCMWEITNDSYNISAKWHSTGVGMTIDMEKDANYPDWEVLTVDGQKSVFFRSSEEAPGCLGYIGMHPQLALVMVATHAERRGEARPDEACDLLKSYAEEFVPNIKQR